MKSKDVNVNVLIFDELASLLDAYESFNEIHNTEMTTPIFSILDQLNKRFRTIMDAADMCGFLS